MSSEGAKTGRKELYPGQQREAKAAAERAQAMREAAAEPLPGPLAEAFAHLPDQVAGLRVRTVVHYDFIILRALKSPLLDHLAAAAKGRKKASPFSDEQGYEMIYQFTRPAEELAALFEKHGASFPKEFRRLARREVGFRLGPVEVGLLTKMVEQAFVAAFSTHLQFAAKEPDPGGQVFTPPPAATTGSAGGSNTSAG
jgi:hypothetical protein